MQKLVAYKEKQQVDSQNSDVYVCVCVYTYSKASSRSWERQR